MLDAVVRRAEALGTRPEVVGIEIDPVLAALARVPPGPRPARCVQVLEGDAFSILGGLQPGPAAHGFDAVIGNPPYVRYQSLATLMREGESDLMRGLERVFPRLTESRRVAALIRACLVLPTIEPTPTRPAKALRAAFARLADPAAVHDPLDRLWVRLIAGYSGLSDLSLPTWLLAWLATRPGGTVAFVANESPQRREYGRVLRYFQLRFLQPLLTVHPADTAWFPDAQVPASLQVFRVRPRHETLVPLARRREEAPVWRIELPRDPNLKVAAKLARALSRANGSPAALPRGPWKASVRDEGELVADLMTDEAASRGRQASAVTRLESRSRTQLEIRGVVGPPREVGEVSTAREYQLLSDVGVSVHQGLRTGCNTFFYVERVGRDQVRTHPVLGGVQLPREPDLFRPVVRNQRDLSGLTVHARSLPWLAFVAGSAARRRDIAALVEFPKTWRQRWRDEGLATMPAELDDWVGRAERSSVRVRGRDVPIPTLSAVAPNARRPRDGGPTRAPSRPAWWYTLPLAPRHDAPLFLARVTHDELRPALNDPRRPVLVDSNFITFTFGPTAPPPAALLAVLWSTWAAACLECAATPMGGGALKVEAAHLRRLVLPVLSDTQWSTLAQLGAELSRAKTERALELRDSIDELVCPEAKTRKRLRTLVADRRRRRRERANRRAAS